VGRGRPNTAQSGNRPRSRCSSSPKSDVCQFPKAMFVDFQKLSLSTVNTEVCGCFRTCLPTFKKSVSIVKSCFRQCLEIVFHDFIRSCYVYVEYLLILLTYLYVFVCKCSLIVYISRPDRNVQGDAALGGMAGAGWRIPHHQRESSSNFASSSIRSSTSTQ
jgi:hypothetical protein